MYVIDVLAFGIMALLLYALLFFYVEYTYLPKKLKRRYEEEQKKKEENGRQPITINTNSTEGDNKGTINGISEGGSS